MPFLPSTAVERYATAAVPIPFKRETAISFPLASAVILLKEK